MQFCKKVVFLHYKGTIKADGNWVNTAKRKMKHTEIKRTPRTLTVNGLKFRVSKYFDIMEGASVEEVLFQNGMMEQRRMKIDEFMNMVKDYEFMKSRNGSFLEPKGNRHVDNEIYPR